MNKDSNRAKRVAEQLGMSQGAAQGQLRKKILFSLLTRLKENVCFKCGLIIDKADDLSIEHKQPWENRSASLFWDLENIAFSHLECNRPHSHSREDQKKIGPEGTAWCSSHKQFLPKEKFWKHSGNWSGVARRCAECVTNFDTRINHANYIRKDLRAASVTVASPSPKR